MALFPLPVKVELLLNGVWTDISHYVYQRDPIVITGGRTNQGDTAQPAQCTMTLNNRDGRFSPNYSGGAYFPYLLRNAQLRVSLVSAQSSSGNTYSGYRFWGEVSHWPPLSDITGADVYVQITASGPLRRVRTGGGKGSALTRYYQTLTGSQAPVAYWPCEEDPQTTIIGAGIDGGTTMTVTTGTPKWKAISDFNGSGPIGVLNNSTWDGLTGSFNASGLETYNTPGNYVWVAPVSSVDVRCVGPGGLGSSAVVGSAGGGGGGGEDAEETALAVTIGNSYPFTIPAGDGTGTPMIFVGDSVTVTAHAGGNASGSTGGTKGTGSANAAHHDGGAGANATAGPLTSGGGGSSGGTSAAGNNASGATGGAAVTGGGAGANGAVGGSTGAIGATPGGGGAGAVGGPGNRAGGFGGSAQVVFTYTPQSVATTNVVRFILLVPKHGGNNGKVLLRAKTGSAVIDHLDFTYVTGGKLRLQGFNASNTQQFDSGAQSWSIDGQTIMVSAELSNSGANIAWAFKAVIPGNTSLIGSASGTVTTAAVGNVTEVIVGPNADITKSAIGHISVQYALVNLLKTSKALDGHRTEMGIDRFIRLCNEQALGNLTEFLEASDHWGFESGTQSWVGTNCALTNPTSGFTPLDPNLTIFPAWPAEGAHSLLLTANGGGQPTATSPTGTSGQPVVTGDTVSVNAEVYAPVTLNNVFVGLLWYTSGGSACSHAEDDSADVVVTGGTMATIRVKAVAPSTAAFYAVKVGDHNADPNNTLLYVDNVRTHPRMGPQTRKEYHKYLEEIEDLDQGILKEAKEVWGLKYRTRIRLLNQSPAITLDYSQAELSAPLAPVIDDKQTKNDITAHRHKGSKVRITLNNGTMSVLEPPAGAGRYKKHLRVVAEEDAQLAALVNHLLGLGTAGDERYPTITVDLSRAGIPGHPLAPLMSAVAGAEIGDYVKLTNLAFWYPNTTAKQLVIGYTENVSAYQWDITWNCTPEAPYEIISTSLRRW